jgi:hypothetical protein
MAGRRPGLPALLLLLTLLAGCELFDDGPGAAGAVARPAAPAAVAPAATATRPSAPIKATAGLAATPTPTPIPASPTPGATATATAAPTRLIAAAAPRAAASGYRRHNSTRYPYAIDYLETWRIVAEGARFEGGEADLFAGERRGPVTNLATVFAQPLADGTTVELFFEASVAELADAGVTAGQEQERTIDGHVAYVFAYTMSRDNQSYAITQAVFVREGQGWVLTLTAAPEDNDRLVPVFRHMLDSFQALG